jgi:predicted MFS family arabinose efflux permease
MTTTPSVHNLGAPVIVIMAIASALTVANVYFNQALLPAIATDFGVSPREAGLIATVSQLGYALGILLVVPLGDRNEPRSLVRILLIGVAAALAAASSAPKLSILAGLSIVICMGTCVPQIVLPLAAGLTHPERRGRVIASVQTGLVLGILLSRTLAGIGANSFGWRPVYIIAAGLMVSSAIVLPTVLPRRGTVSATMPYLTLLGSLWGLLRREASLRLSCLLGAAIFAAFSAFWTTIPFRLGRPPFNFDLAGVGYFALWGGIGGLASLFAGGLIDRFGQDRVSAGAIMLAALSIGLGAISPDSYIALVAGGNLLSFALSAGQVANQARIFSLGAEVRSRLNTIYMAFTFVGGAIGSAGAGIVWASHGWVGVCGFALVCVAVAGAALMRAHIIATRQNSAGRQA